MYKSLLASTLLSAMLYIQPCQAQSQNNTVPLTTASAQKTDAQPVADTPPQTTPPKKPHAFLVNENVFKYWVGGSFREPYVNDGRNLTKHIVEFAHVDKGNRLGDNVFDMQYLMSNHLNPVGELHGNLENGAKDVYMTYRHDLSLNRLFKTNRFKFGLIQDVMLEAGADFGSKNDDFSNQRRSPMVGPAVSLKVPNHGYWNLAAMWTKEWNEEGTDITSYFPGTTIPATWGKKVVYDSTYTIQTSWGVPFALGKAPFSFEGFGVFNGAKGYQAGTLVAFAPGVYREFVNGTKPETILHPEILYNIGSLLGEGHVYQIGVGYEWWNNKFGVDHHKAPGALANTPFLIVQVHL